MSDLWLDKITYEFSQEGNTDGTTNTEGYDDSEVLTIEVRLIKESGYLILRTPTSWSFNDMKELEEIINIVKNGVPIE